MSYIKNTVASVAMLFTSVVLTSCNDFLDCEPLDKITPDAYFNSVRGEKRCVSKFGRSENI